jgi:negative modulator of initiation of replication
MKTITIDDELYAHIAAQTKYIGEGASDILRRLLLPESAEVAIDRGSQPLPVVEPETPASPRQLDIDTAAILVCSTVVERFLLVLSAMHSNNTDVFTKVLNIRGKGRDYFAKSEQHLLATGSSTNPKPIPGSEYWVVTNNNTSKKASILRLVSEAMGYDKESQQNIAQTLTMKN